MFGRDSFVLERRRVVAHVHADHKWNEVGGILLATLYTGTGGRVHEELEEPHCWLHRWANGTRPSVKVDFVTNRVGRYCPAHRLTAADAAVSFFIFNLLQKFE